jgi:Uma2 family endonuclease
MKTGIHTSIASYLAHEPPPGMRDELIKGEIVMMPNPKPEHVGVCSNLHWYLRTVLQGSEYTVHQRTNILLESEQSMPSPDVFVIDKARWKRAMDGSTYPEGSPQLAIEVASRSNRPAPFRKKIFMYLDNDAAAVWVVYPKRMAIVVHDSDGEQEYRVGEEIPLPAPLPRVSISVAEIFELF